MMINLVIAIMSLINLTIICIKYFSGTQINTQETKIYKYLLINSIIESLLGIILFVSVPSQNEAIIFFLNSLYMTSMNFWITLFSLYVICISEQEDDKYEKTKTIFLSLSAIITFFTFLLGSEINLYSHSIFNILRGLGALFCIQAIKSNNQPVLNTSILFF